MDGDPSHGLVEVDMGLEGNEEMKEAVFSRIEAREAARRDDVAQRALVAAAQANPEEQIESFLEDLGRVQATVETILEGAEAREGTGHLEEALDEAARELSDTLVPMVTEGAQYLPATQLGYAQNILKQLEQRMEVLRQRLAKSTTFTFGASTVEDRQRRKAEKKRRKEERERRKAEKRKRKLAAKAKGKENATGMEPVEGLRGASEEGERQAGIEKDAGAEKDAGSLMIRDQSNETILVSGPLRTIHFLSLSGCEVRVTAAVSGSVFVRDCTDCVFHLPCQQLRMHDSTLCRMYLCVGSKPIIEGCEDVGFAPLPIAGSEAGSEAEAEIPNHWDQVQDFLWHKSTPSPHWFVIPEEERVVS